MDRLVHLLSAGRFDWVRETGAMYNLPIVIEGASVMELRCMASGNFLPCNQVHTQPWLYGLSRVYAMRTHPYTTIATL